MVLTEAHAVNGQSYGIFIVAYAYSIARNISSVRVCIPCKK